MARAQGLTTACHGKNKENVSFGTAPAASQQGLPSHECHRRRTEKAVMEKENRDAKACAATANAQKQKKKKQESQARRNAQLSIEAQGDTDKIRKLKGAI
jgi:hypothetical protein